MLLAGISLVKHKFPIKDFGNDESYNIRILYVLFYLIPTSVFMNKILFDFFPIVLFFIAYKNYDLYVATAVVIAATSFCQ
jgi:uncharacterized ion transporter superfamily protein YfcC